MVPEVFAHGSVQAHFIQPTTAQYMPYSRYDWLLCTSDVRILVASYSTVRCSVRPPRPSSPKVSDLFGYGDVESIIHFPIPDLTQPCSKSRPLQVLPSR
jgi:hypothetical protein